MYGGPELLGWLGAFFFSICAAPQAFKAFKDGHSQGISLLFLFLWFCGEFCMIFYTLLALNADAPLLVNYIFNLLCLFVILKYKVSPRPVNPVIKLVKRRYR